MKIGILGFQGAVIEHQRHIEQLGQEAVVVRYTEQLAEIDGIILPGGESTTMGKLLNRTGMMEPLREKIQQGMPVWGTCRHDPVGKGVGSGSGCAFGNDGYHGQTECLRYANR